MEPSLLSDVYKRQLYDQAILPWDDDIDIGMTRENYNKFLKVAPGELGPSYFLSWIRCV